MYSINFMKSQDIDFQRAAAKLLRSISVGQKTRDILSNNDAISILVKVLTDTSDFTLKLALTATLWNLSVNKDNKSAILKSGVIKLFVEFLAFGNTKLKNEAVGALRNLSLDKDCQSAIVKEGAISHLAKLLKSDVDKIQRNSAATLRNLVINDENNLITLQKEGVMKTLNSILQKNNMELKPSSAVLSNKSLQAYFCDLIKWDDLVISDKVGEGKYGNVYKAEFYNYPVACKVIKKKLLEKDIESTMEELKMMRKLKHPNVVQLIGTSINPLNQVVIVTELLSRGNLKEILPDVPSLMLRLNMGQDIANGLFWLHCHNIIHRDLKLANLLVSESWKVKISDFGLSLDLSKKEICHGFKGNIKYSPPEILRARSNGMITIYPYSEKTDVYAYGLILWELISLEPLFPYIRGKEELTKHVLTGERPEMPNSWPSSVQELLSSCWHDNPSKRPLFVSILESYETSFIDLMCPDPLGRKVCKKLWKGKKDAIIPFDEFYDVFSQIVVGLSKIKKINLKCLFAILCDYYADTVNFEKFCLIIRSFGPLDPIETFFKRVKDIVSNPAFHGFISISKAINLVQNYYKTSKVCCFLYRFMSAETGTFSLTHIDKNSELFHQTITYNYKNGNYSINGFSIEFVDFVQVHRTLKESFRLKKHVPGNPYLTAIAE